METIAHEFKNDLLNFSDQILQDTISNKLKCNKYVNLVKFNSEQIRQCESAIVPKCGQQNMSLPAHPAFQISNQPWK